MSSAAVPYYLVIPAAGSGSRFGSDIPKQYSLINGKPLLHHAIKAASAGSGCLGVVVALAGNDSRWAMPEHHVPIATVEGGVERVDSVTNALAWIKQHAEQQDILVVVHDAARPFLPKADLEALLVKSACSAAGAILAAPVADTVKRVSNAAITETVDRSELWRALTPQAFSLSLLERAFANAVAKGINVTDESSAVESLGLQPQIVQGSAANIKVTLPEDLRTVTAQMEAI